MRKSFFEQARKGKEKGKGKEEEEKTPRKMSFKQLAA